MPEPISGPGGLSQFETKPQFGLSTMLRDINYNKDILPVACIEERINDRSISPEDQICDRSGWSTVDGGRSASLQHAPLGHSPQGRGCSRRAWWPFKPRRSLFALYLDGRRIPVLAILDRRAWPGRIADHAHTTLSIFEKRAFWSAFLFQEDFPKVSARRARSNKATITMANTSGTIR